MSDHMLYTRGKTRLKVYAMDETGSVTHWEDADIHFTGEFECDCGEEFTDPMEAREHLYEEVEFE